MSIDASPVTIILGKKYTVLDTYEYITLADSFLKNKIGTAHGEGKLYVGNQSESLFSFFSDFNLRCFFLKSDFVSYLKDAKDEFLFPQQEYQNKERMPKNYPALLEEAEIAGQEVLSFSIFRVDVKPPRVYIKSESEWFMFMRNIGLPNISYLSVMKIQAMGEEELLYFRMFLDYKSDLVKYVLPAEQKEAERIAEDTHMSEKRRTALIEARVGQGAYRKKLLEECLYCPFTKVNDERLLVASHLKPWVDSTSKEKLDHKNGIVCTPTFDRLIDRGFITIQDDRTLLVSPWISPLNQKRLGIHNGKLIESFPLDSARKKYLAYHREHIFKA